MAEVAPRRIIGFLAMLVTGFFMGLISSSPRFSNIVFSEQYLFVPTVTYFVLSFVPVIVGAYISRRDFLPVAVSFFLVLWAFSQYILYQIALPAGPVSLFNIALANVPSLVMLILSGVLGSLIGEWLYRQQTKIAANAA